MFRLLKTISSPASNILKGATSPFRRTNGQTLLQKRKKTDAYSAADAITYESRLLRLAQAPKNSIAYDIFNTLQKAGKVEYYSKSVQGQEDIQPTDKLLQDALALINSIARDHDTTTTEVKVDSLMALLLKMSTSNCKFVHLKPKHRAEIQFRDSSLVAVYDFAIHLDAYMKTSKNDMQSPTQISEMPMKPLVAFVVKDHQGTHSRELHGPMVAQMLVQATLNYNEWTRVRYMNRTIEFPKQIRDNGIFIATAIKVAGTKIRIYRAEIPEYYIDTVVHGATPVGDVKKFVIQEYDSPSGDGFDIMNVNDLRAFMNFLVTFFTNCEKEVMAIMKNCELRALRAEKQRD